MLNKLIKLEVDAYIPRDYLLSLNGKMIQVKFCIKNKENKWIAAVIPAYNSLLWVKLKNKYKRKGEI